MISALSCSRQPAPSIDAQSTGWCDTRLMKPIGRPVEIPSVRVLPQFGAVTGTVVQAETGDALEGAVVNLRQNSDAKPQSQPWRYTDSKGGFAFDSLAPGGYRLQVRRIGEYQDTLTIHTVTGRVDTVRFRMRAYRCYGY
jgi:hypothetical protein